MKAWKLADYVRSYTPLPKDGRRRCLLLWWGSFRGMDATVGDCMAVANMALGLSRRGALVEISAFHDFNLPGIATVHPAMADPGRYRAVCFVCGPLRAKRKFLQMMRRYAECYRVAAGVSVLDDEGAILSEFDEIIARDGAPNSYFDLALADPWRELFPHPSKAVDAVAICFRGAQSRVGPNRHSLHSRAEAALNAVAEQAANGSPIIKIDTVASNHIAIRRVLEQFAASRLMLTTRLHGSLLSLEFGIPFIAVDQISGGHKVSEVLRKVGWPYVFSAESLDAAQLEHAVQAVTNASIRPVLHECRQIARVAANNALSRACEVVQSRFPALREV